MKIRSASAVLLAGTFTLLCYTPAFADDYLNAAVQSLQANQVYVSPEVRGIDQAALEQAIGDDDIAVAIMPTSASANNGGTAGFLSSLTAQSDHDTFIVAIGTDLEAASRVMEPGTASQIANTQEIRNSSVTDAIVATINGVKTDQVAVTETPRDTPQSDGVDWTPLFTGALVVALIISGLMYLTIHFLNRQKAKERIGVIRFKLTPAAVRERTQSVLELRSLIDDPALVQSLSNTGRHIEAYFKNAKPMPDGSYRSADIIRENVDRLHAVMDRYIKVQDEPQYYRDATRRQREYAEAAMAFERFMLEQVRSANADEEFDSRQAAEILAATELRSIRAEE